MSKDISVIIHHGTDEFEISFIQEISKAVQDALHPLGFSKVESSTTGQSVEIDFHQYGRAIARPK